MGERRNRSFYPGGQLICLALLALTLFLVQTKSASAAWPIKDFEVVLAEPEGADYRPEDYAEKKGDQDRDMIDEGLDWLQGLAEDDEIKAKKALADDAWVRLVKGYLREIAAVYEGAGFSPPALPIYEEKGQRAYKIFLYDFQKFQWGQSLEARGGGAQGVVYLFGCYAKKQRYQWLAIDRGDFTFSGKSLPQGEIAKERELYITLAHELFHAIQGTYDERYNSIRNCGRLSDRTGQRTIVEGMAEGAATYVATQKWPDLLERTTESFTLGVFDYGTNDFMDDDNINPYETSGFWRYLAERFGGLHVLRHLLETPLADLDADLTDRYHWLDLGLKQSRSVREKFYLLFPEFLTEHASYISRYKAYNISDWYKDNFSGCSSVELNKANNWAQAKTIPWIPPNTSRCIRLNWVNVSTPFELDIEAQHKDTFILDQLHLGLAQYRNGPKGGPGGESGFCWQMITDERRRNPKQAECVHSKPFISSGPSQNSKVKSWQHVDTSLFESDGIAILILTNMGTMPWQTQAAKSTKILFSIRAGFHFAAVDGTVVGGRTLTPPQAQEPKGLSQGIPGDSRYKGYGIDPGGQRPPVSLPKLSVGSKIMAGSDPETSKTVGAYSVNILDERVANPNYTGPVNGLVSAGYDLESINAQSGLCRDSEISSSIGTIVRRDRQQLVIKVDTDLCYLDDTTLPPKIRYKEHLRAEFVVPFGWRYFSQSAPLDIVTPGLEIYIDKYYEDVAATGLPMSGFGDQQHGQVDNQRGPSTPGHDGPTGPGTVGGGEFAAACSCSCAEYEEIQAANAQNNVSEEDADRYALCNITCMSQYMECQDR